MSLELYFSIVAFVFGAIIGSFLNVLIYRLHTGKSLNDRSHCLSCQKPLRWFELFPIFSYLTLRGRCRGCRSYIPVRYALVELLTACSFLYIYLITDSAFELILLCTLAATLIVGLVYDLYHMIIPNEVPLVLLVVAVLIVTVHYREEGLLLGVGLPLLCGLLASGFYGLLWLASQGRWLGLGDAKLAFPLGLLLSISGAFSMIVLSFWIGAGIALLLLAYQTARRYLITKRYSRHPVVNYEQYLTMKSEIPFAPFLVLAFVLVYFLGVDVLALTDYVISSFLS